MTDNGESASSGVRGKVSTGYARLDEALQGGFLVGSMIVLTAAASDEVPLLLRSFLESTNDSSLLICRTLSTAENMATAENVKALVCSDKPVPPTKNTIPGKGIDNLTDLNIQLTDVLGSCRPKRVTVDVLSDILLRHKALQTRKWLTELLEKMRSKDITGLFVVNPYMHSTEEVQAVVGLFDGSLEITQKKVEGKLTKLLCINWMHRVEIVQKELSLVDLRPELQTHRASTAPPREQRILTSVIGRTGRMPTSGSGMRTGTTVLGTVLSLWRYPVKSMMGEELNAADITELGILGDRVYALFDPSSGKVASAKNPLKWAKLFDCRATFIDPPVLGSPMPPVRITLPDGSLVTSAQVELEPMLSQVFAREVRFASAAPEKTSFEEYWPDIEGLAHREMVTDEGMPPNSFFDFGVIHLLTTRTLSRLRELYPQGRFEVRRFRPNIVVEPTSSGNDFIENAWIGRTLSLGEQVQLKVIAPCPRCVMTTLPQGDLPKDPGILRTAAIHTPRIEAEGFGVLSANVGVYADVLRGGKIQRGDLLKME